MQDNGNREYVALLFFIVLALDVPAAAACSYHVVFLLHQFRHSLFYLGIKPRYPIAFIVVPFQSYEAIDFVFEMAVQARHETVNDLPQLGAVILDLTLLYLVEKCHIPKQAIVEKSVFFHVSVHEARYAGYDIDLGKNSLLFDGVVFMEHLSPLVGVVGEVQLIFCRPVNANVDALQIDGVDAANDAVVYYRHFGCEPSCAGYPSTRLNGKH